MDQKEYIGLERDLDLELKKYEQSETNRRGIILITRRAENHDEAVRKMIEYLNSTNKKTEIV